MPTPAELAASAQLLYVAYYGRPADPGGLDFWIEKFSESDNVDQVLIDFGESDEFLVTRGNSDAVSLINGLYQQMFNRNADQAGMDYYREQLNTGQASLASIALDIANGAVEGTDDYQVLHNKIEVASIFTRLVREENADYNRVHLARARALLESVDETTASVAEGAVQATEFVSGLAVVVPPDPTNPTEPTDPTDPTGPTGPTTPPVSRDPGKSYTLTEGVDTFQSGTGNDRFSATDLTLLDNDRILDSGQGIDRDVMTLALNAPLWQVKADIDNVETINIRFGKRAATGNDPETTSDGTVDAENISGATLVLRSGDSAFGGEATVNNLGNNKVVASTGITELTVTGLTGGSVDGGRATTVTVTGTPGTANQIKVAGTVTLTNSTSDKTTLITSGTSRVTYDTTAGDITTTVQGSGNLVLVMAQDDVVAGTSIVNEKSSGTLTLDMTSTDGANFDASNFEVDNILVGDATEMPTKWTVEAKVADGQEIDVVAALSSLTVTSDKDNASVIIDTDFDIDALDVRDVGGLSIDITVAKATEALVIGTLTAGSNSVTLRGSGDVTVTSTDASTIDASGLSGDFTLETASTTTAGDKFTFTGARGTNTVVVANGKVTDYNGGGGTDNIDASLVQNGTLDFELQGGNDRVTLGGAATGTMIVAIDGGSGTDTIVLKNSTNLSAIGTFALRDVERFELENITVGTNTVDTVGVTFAGSQLSGESYTILTAEADDTATLNVTANAGSTDLSRLILQKIDEVVLTGNSNNETLIGNSTNDRIISGGGMDQITGGRGNDKFEFGAGHSTKTAMTKISDYRASDGMNNKESDTIVLSNATIAADLAASDAENVASAADSSDASEGDDIIALIDTGILTLFGLNRDRIDTLSEWIEVLEVSGVASGNVAFEFGGNTYLATVSSSSVDNIVELTGVTGITAISETEAANTIHIA